MLHLQSEPGAEPDNFWSFLLINDSKNELFLIKFCQLTNLRLQLTIVFTVNCFLNASVSSLTCKMSENYKKHFPKPKMTSSNVLFCPQPKNNQFSFIEEERNQKIFSFKKLESENFYLFS